MGYCDDSDSVRVDFFKESGKWYTTEAIKFLDYNSNSPVDSLKKSLREHFKDTPNRLSDMTAVCLEPYHQYSFPVMVKVSTIYDDLVPYKRLDSF